MHDMRRLLLISEGRGVLVDTLTFLAEDFDLGAFVRKIEAVSALTKRGATPGETNAGKLAMQRLVDRARAEAPKLPEKQRQKFAGQIKQITGVDISAAAGASASGTSDTSATSASDGEDKGKTPATDMPQQGQAFYYNSPSGYLAKLYPVGSSYRLEIYIDYAKSREMGFRTVPGHYRGEEKYMSPEGNDFDESGRWKEQPDRSWVGCRVRGNPQIISDWLARYNLKKRDA